MQIKQHRLTGAKWLESAFYNQRPNNEISLLVIHCISLPEGCFGLPHIDQLFTGSLDCSADPSFKDLQGLEVSAHLLINRAGEVTQYVAFDKRAWHAGVSCYQGREGCNDFSIGIELEGTDSSEYTKAQYQGLIEVSQLLLKHYPKLTKQRIVAHSDIAPGRKTDPGEHFDWSAYLEAL
ncbi:1,6-anhydro-N-acetylmuramyl-L-alanine amidase AmpD [Agarivorans litoreus]|uniref:1,6-anhydro-N-acetylmuramyl-L-alanine amidase AmpD n=1 Tax=Agarivorans litoreus TaxID=1510455 RepID=UPI001C7D3524|nr:1,6-anhydro-N-acetylmuramyl-L-alanine amidase AmpD [Agarivorans litoreus]